MWLRPTLKTRAVMIDTVVTRNSSAGLMGPNSKRRGGGKEEGGEERGGKGRRGGRGGEGRIEEGNGPPF